MLDNLIRDVITSYDKSNFGSKDKIFFLKELGHLVHGGVGILEAVQIINQNTDNYALKSITAEMAGDLKSGKSLSMALMRHLQYFDEGDVAILQSGEKSWNMGKILQSLANEYHFIAKIKSKYTSALMYPAVLLVIALGAVIALFAFVLPGVFSIADQFPDMQIPPITRALQVMSAFLVEKRFRLLLGSWFVILLSIVIFSTWPGQSLLFSLILRVPVIGVITRNYYLIKFSRYAKIMLEAGMNYVETFRLLKGILDIPVYESLLDTTLGILIKGGSVYMWLADEPDLIPSTVSALIKVGEKVGSLPAAFGNVIEIYEEDLESDINNLSKVIEPVMMVVIGGIVVVVALGVFGVITNIMDAVKM